MDASHGNSNGAPNLLIHAPLPAGSDNAIGGVTGGTWLSTIRKIFGAIFGALF